MRITWSAPNSDGGSPITKYAVEIRDDKSEWRHQCFINKGTGKRIEGLLKGNKYQFRVKGWNEAGAGIASEPSEMKLCYPLLCTYSADLLFFVIVVLLAIFCKKIFSIKK